MKELKSAPLVALVAVGSSTLASAASKPSSRLPHVIQLPIVRDTNRYIAEITVGTPPQRINMTIDIGSAFTWLLSSDESLCQSHADSHTAGGGCGTTRETAQKFNSSASSTYKPHRSDGFAAYRNGHHVQGYQNFETFNLNGIAIAHLQLNMVQNSNLETSGILGLGNPN
ncbi:aspartic peptidase domain-containing protein [Leptodontidium sp. MPI-SDFR-AT-0119]|nr:aspartic peptidase domain-containing protein [Leptodontidium sp. MPI-SDFR-AT-0119]